MSSASLGSRTRRRMKFPSCGRSRKTVAVISLSLSIIGLLGSGGTIGLKTIHNRGYCGGLKKNWHRRGPTGRLARRLPVDAVEEGRRGGAHERPEGEAKHRRRECFSTTKHSRWPFDVVMRTTIMERVLPGKARSPK